MSTSLYAITNSKLTGKETANDFDMILAKLKSFNFVRAKSFERGKWVEDEGEWEYYIYEDECDSELSHIYFDGPYCYSIRLYPRVGVIDTIYKYSFIYSYAEDIEDMEDDWFRNDLYKLIGAIGGSEIIYLADNACDLEDFLLMAEENNIPYENIKQELIKKYGNPITDWKQLKTKGVEYHNIKEFVLDDFKDFK